MMGYQYACEMITKKAYEGRDALYLKYFICSMSIND